MDFLKVGNDDGYMLEFSVEPHSMKKNSHITLYLNDEAILCEYIKKVKRITPTFYDIICTEHCVMIEYCTEALYVIITKNNDLKHKLYFDNIIEKGKKQQLGIMHMFFDD